MNMAQSKKVSKKNISSRIAALDKDSASRLVTIRILIMIAVEVFIGWSLHFLSSDWERGYAFRMSAAFTVLKILFAVFALAAAAYFVITLVKNIDTSADVVTPFMLFAIAMSFAVTIAFYDRFFFNQYLFWIAAAIVVVFFALYYIYTVLMYKK